MKAAQVSPTPAPLSNAGLTTWKRFMRAQSRLVRALDEELRERHGVALGDLDVLVQLGDAADGCLRMSELADAVVLTPSGLSRRVDRLERDGLVVRERAERDARSVEARLTTAGKRLLARLRTTHREGVKARFEDEFSADELETLGDLLGRLTADDE